VVGEWQSSDRPPLQTGILLSQRTWGSLLPNDMHYQAMGTMLQCSWIPAVWLLCRSLTLKPFSSLLVVCLLASSGFVMVNSVYVWPKMLGGAMAVFAFVLCFGLFCRAPGEWTRAGLLAASIAMSMLSHPSTLFTIGALVLVWFLPGFSIGRWQALLTVGITIILLAPWELYRHYYDPPGTRLIRWHIAGANLMTEKGALRAVIDAYAAKDFWGIAAYKVANISVLAFENPKALYWGYPHSAAQPLSWRDWEGLRRREFHNLFFALGILNTGWMAAIWCFWRQGGPADRRFQRALTGLAGFVALNMLLWLALMFGPGTTVLFQGSYALELLMCTLLAACLVSLPRIGWSAILVLQLLWFITVWIVTSPANRYGIPNFFAIAVGLCSGLVLAYLTWRLIEERSSHLGNRDRKSRSTLRSPEQFTGSTLEQFIG
jgi:hypothetical protein